MEYRRRWCEKKDSFTVLGVAKKFAYETCKDEIPEWLPAFKEYEFATGCCVEMYGAADKYPKGTLDENYHSEI